MNVQRLTVTSAFVWAAIVGSLAWVIGVSWPRSVLIGSVVLIVVAGQGLANPRDVVWPDRTDERRHGTRNDVSSLSWSLIARRGAVTDRARQRLRALATARLAGHGIDLDDPAHAHEGRRLLGVAAWEAITAEAEDGRPVRTRAFLAAITALERLDPSPHLAGPADATVDDGFPAEPSPAFDALPAHAFDALPAHVVDPSPAPERPR